LLPHIAEEDERDQLSSKGFAYGYLGGGILLAVNLAMIMTAAPFVLVTLDLATPLRLPVEVWFFYWVGGVWFIAILTAWTALPYVRGALGRG